MLCSGEYKLFQYWRRMRSFSIKFESDLKKSDQMAQGKIKTSCIYLPLKIVKQYPAIYCTIVLLATIFKITAQF